MDSRTRLPQMVIAGVWAGAVLTSLAAPAHAVIPGLAGPLQALIQALPQILPVLGAAIVGVMGVPAWRARFYRFGRWARTGRGMGFCAASIGIAAVGVGLMRSQDRSQVAAMAAAPAAAAPAATADWPVFRGNLSRTGAAAGAKGPEKAGVVWSFKDADAEVADMASSPVVVGGRVYVGSAQASIFDSTGMVYGIDAATGKQVWRFQTDKQVFSSPAVVGGRVYVGEGLHVDEGCKVYCLDAATGKKIWATPTKGHTESSPAVVGGRVYIGAGDDGFYCLNAATGKVVWRRGGMHIDVSPAVAGGKVFVGTGYGKLGAMALDAATGKTVWQAPSDLPVWGPPSVSGNSVFFGVGNGDFVKSASSPRGAVWCVDAATGKTKWRRDVPDAVLTAILLHGGRAYAGSRDGNVYALDAADGKILWKTPCGGPVVASLTTDGTRLYAAGSKGQVNCLDLKSGAALWSMDLKPHTAADVNVFSSPAVSGGRLYLGTSKEKLFCLGV